MGRTASKHQAPGGGLLVPGARHSCGFLEQGGPGSYRSFSESRPDGRLRFHHRPARFDDGRRPVQADDRRRALFLPRQRQYGQLLRARGRTAVPL